MSLPVDLDEFHAVLKRRIRDQTRIDGLREDASTEQRRIIGAKTAASQENRHVVGQTGCFCLDCLLFRKQEWRIGDVNQAIAGPRDEWRLHAWGSSERFALHHKSLPQSAAPELMPAIKETIQVKTSKRGLVTISRDAKFSAVASGKYHTLMLSESSNVFAFGDNAYGAVGVAPDPTATTLTPITVPTMVTQAISATKGTVRQIAASGFASFALVVLPPTDSTDRPASVELKRARDRRGSIGMMASRFDPKDAVIQNHVFSWGRGDRGALGHGDTSSSPVPRIVRMFDTKRVLEISAGLQHVLVLTEHDGVFAFGSGSHGKLGFGDTSDRCAPARINGLDGFNIVHICAGNDHSVAVAGETLFNRQVYSWGLGSNGRLGHGDDASRLKPTRINFFRGRKVITVAAGGTHNLALTEMAEGVCVWSWGCGTYGQLGHRDTWDALVPRSVDEIRRENIRSIDAGERHSLAVSESMALWVWGQGIHGDVDMYKPDPSSSSVLFPIKVLLPDVNLVGAHAGRDRTFVWGDRVLPQENNRDFGGSSPEKVCCALPEYESLSSDSFRILFRCGSCNLPAICIACAHRCHIQHCLELTWTLHNTLDRSCDCISSSDECVFAKEA